MVPCDWVDEPAAQDVVPVRQGGCVVQQRLASQLVVLGETVLHGVCSQSGIDLFLSAQPGHAETHPSGTAVYALDRICLHPSALQDTTIIAQALVLQFCRNRTYRKKPTYNIQGLQAVEVTE